MRTSTIFLTLVLIYGIYCLQGCKKYLDAKSDDKIAIVSTLVDAQALLDNYEAISSSYPFGSETLSDNYYLTVTPATDFDKYLYSWQKFDGEGGTDWSSSYGAIFNCNTVLDAYGQIMKDQAETSESNNILGSALFFRAYYFYAIAQLYSPIYNEGTASIDLGIPLRMDADFINKSTRATVKETYDRIITDLKRSLSLLPETPLIKTRPSRPAVYGALARVYLSMRDYQNAGLYADSCLQLCNKLIDFNSLNKTSSAPFARFSEEVIFHIRSKTASYFAISPSRAKIDSALYASYHEGDLRKAVYFRSNTGINTGTYNFKGNYDGQSVLGQSGLVFGGIVTDEMYLIRAESFVRAGNVDLAMEDLNTLLRTRWEGVYTDLVATDEKEALNIILAERRKELLYRGTRWTDMRRFSMEPEHVVIPKRIIGDEIYELQPGSPRYVLPIPENVIRLSGMQQNL